MPTDDELLARIDVLEARIRTLEANEAAREQARLQAVAGAMARRASAEAAVQQAAADERAALLQRRAELAKQSPPSATVIHSVRIGGLAATAVVAATQVVVEGKPRTLGVSVTVEGKTVAVEGTTAALTAFARTLFDEGEEPGRRAAKAIYARLRMTAPAWLQGRPR